MDCVNSRRTGEDEEDQSQGSQRREQKAYMGTQRGRESGGPQTHARAQEVYAM